MKEENFIKPVKQLQQKRPLFQISCDPRKLCSLHLKLKAKQDAATLQKVQEEEQKEKEKDTDQKVLAMENEDRSNKIQITVEEQKDEPESKEEDQSLTGKRSENLPGMRDLENLVVQSTPSSARQGTETEVSPKK